MITENGVRDRYLETGNRDHDGLPATVTAYNAANHLVPVVTAYSYNHRRLLGGQGETLTQPEWYSWGLGYGYDANGNLASHVYPSRLTVTYAPMRKASRPKWAPSPPG